MLRRNNCIFGLTGAIGKEKRPLMADGVFERAVGRWLFLRVDFKPEPRRRRRFQGTGERNDAIIESEIIAERFGRIAFWVDRDEDRRDLACIRPEFIERGAHGADIAGAHIRAKGIAEIDHHDLALKVFVTHRQAAFIDQGEIARELRRQRNHAARRRRRRRLPFPASAKQRDAGGAGEYD